MRLIVVYRDESEHARPVIEYRRDFKKQTGYDIETLDPDTHEGIEFCRAYGIVEYPTVIAVSSDGRMQNMWRGLPLPVIFETSQYAQ